MKKIRTAMDSDEYLLDVRTWLANEMLPALQDVFNEKSIELGEKYDVESHLVLTSLAGLHQRAAKSFTGWMAAESRAEGATLQDIADALGYASNSHVKRAHPELDAVVDVIKRVEQTGEVELTQVDGHGIYIHPAERSPEH